MNPEDIATALRSKVSGATAVALAELLGELTDGGPSQSAMIVNFHRAFPAIPLPVLLQAGGWSRVSGGGITDDEFNELLRPWLSPQ